MIKELWYTTLFWMRTRSFGPPGYKDGGLSPLEWHVLDTLYKYKYQHHRPCSISELEAACHPRAAMIHLQERGFIDSKIIVGEDVEL